MVDTEVVQAKEAESGGDLPEFAERVLAVVEAIPPAMVLTYGDVAQLLERGGPRQVARVMARYGSLVPWWRVIRADGTIAAQLVDRALEHYRREGTPIRGQAVDLRQARWSGEGQSA